jgi:hypothetical protein
MENALTKARGLRYETFGTKLPLTYGLPSERWPLGCEPEDSPSLEVAMDLKKDAFEDDNELSRLEDEEEIGAGDEIVETEEEELLITDHEPEAAVPVPALKPARKRAAKKRKAKKRAAKKTKKSGKRKAKAKPKRKRGKKAAKKRSKKRKKR